MQGYLRTLMVHHEPGSIFEFERANGIDFAEIAKKWQRVVQRKRALHAMCIGFDGPQPVTLSVQKARECFRSTVPAFYLN